MSGQPEGPRAGRRRALIVATGDYADPGLRRLRAPAQDAAALAGVLADRGIGAYEVTTVRDASERDVRIQTEGFLKDASPADLLLVYLSCHGVLDARGQLFLAAQDTRLDRLAATGIEGAWVLNQLEHCRARSQVLILDSCFSGAFDQRGAKGAADIGLGRRFSGEGRGRVVLTASSAYEYSFEGDDLVGGSSGSVFTAALVQGLRTGEADTAGNGRITVEDIYKYAFDKVMEKNAAQTPQRWLYGGQGQITFAYAPVRSSAADESRIPTGPPTQTAPKAAAAAAEPSMPPAPWSDSLARLRDLLSEGDHTDADLLTTQILLEHGQGGRRARMDFLRSTDYGLLPSALLHQLGQTWMDQTAGKHGFPVQLAEYSRPDPDVAVGGPADFMELAYRVGWRTTPPPERWRWKRYAEFVPPDPPSGFFPTLRNPPMEQRSAWIDQWEHTVLAVHLRLREGMRRP